MNLAAALASMVLTYLGVVIGLHYVLSLFRGLVSNVD